MCKLPRKIDRNCLFETSLGPENAIFLNRTILPPCPAVKESLAGCSHGGFGSVRHNFILVSEISTYVNGTKRCRPPPFSTRCAAAHDGHKNHEVKSLLITGETGVVRVPALAPVVRSQAKGPSAEPVVWSELEFN
jgi:hypothetical protein